MIEALQLQQRTRDEIQQRIHEEVHKKDLKGLRERLSKEDAKLQSKQDNLKEAQSLKDSWYGERLSMEGADRIVHPA